MTGRIIDLYAGPGGWSEALRDLGRGADELGIEWDAAACATRAAAGHQTRQDDVGAIDEQEFAGLEGLIASPPCQGFSSAGKGAARDLIPELLTSIRARRWNDRADPDPRVWLIVNLGRWLEQLDPEWVALEQVPAVLPLWRAYAELLSDRGYSVWTGILNAADFGVPQTRRRAILMASRVRPACPPPPTHAEAPEAGLFDTRHRWVTMADALEWPEHWRTGQESARGAGMTERHGPRSSRRASEPSEVITGKTRSWVVETGNNSQLADGTVEKYSRSVNEPSPTLTGNVGRGWRLRANARKAGTVREADQPAPTLALGKAYRDWAFERPATTVQGDPRLGEPGHRDREGGERQFGVDAIRLSVTDALILQSFRSDYPLQGTKTKQFEQVGNAIPPLLARHILSQLIRPAEVTK